MGGVVIAPNIKKTSVRIDGRGNEIDPKTKQVVSPAEIPYVPTPEQVAQAQPKSDALGDKIQQMIEAKVNKIVEQKIEEALKKLL